MAPQHIDLFTKDSDLHSLAGHVGLLLECAPDSAFLQHAKTIVFAEELLGDYDAFLSHAAEMASALFQPLQDDPELRLFTVFEEVTLEQLVRFQQVLHLDAFLQARGLHSCRFMGATSLAQELQAVQRITRSRYKIESQVPPASTALVLINKLYRRAIAHRPWYEESIYLARRIAPKWSKIASGRVARSSANVPQGGVWFFSTAFNFTQIGLKYAAHLDFPVNFVYENPATGGHGMSRQRSFNLYRWARAKDVPNKREIGELVRRIVETLRAVPLTGLDCMLRDMLLGSAWFHCFQTMLLQSAMLMHSAATRWLAAVKPDLVLLGNAGWERNVILAPSRECLVVLLQHGVIHRTLGVTDQPVDRFLVRGRFFQDLLAKPLRDKSSVLNVPPAAATPDNATADGRKRAILFITAPIYIHPLYTAEEVTQILEILLRVAEQEDRPLIVRVHPTESVHAYRRLVEKLSPQRAPQVSYSQGTPADAVLRQSDVAVSFYSTMFLDCLRYGVPIISLDWHNWPFKEQYKAKRAFIFASSLRHLEELVREGIGSRLTSQMGSIEDFAAPTTAEEVRRAFCSMLTQNR